MEKSGRDENKRRKKGRKRMKMIRDVGKEERRR